MPSETSTQAQLASLIQKLQTERQEHLDAVADIDATFERFSISVAPVKRRGRPRKNAKPGPRRSVAAKAAKTATPAKKGKRKARGQFTMTAEQTILTFVKAAGKKGVTTSEIVKHWRSEGRSGDGYTKLGELVTAKKLKREKITDGQGSRYTVV